MSLSPATTWALVTTTPGAATQPLPSIPSPQAVPYTRTTLGRAAATPPERRTRREGPATSAAGPCTDGSGSSRASASRIGPDGGSSWSSARRIVDPRRSERSGVEPVESSATAPTIQAMPRPTQAVSAAPSSPSICLKPGIRSHERTREPRPSSPLANTPPASSAPTRPNSGAYGDRAPWSSSSGAIRVPRKAPSAKPTSDSAPTTNPCR